VDSPSWVSFFPKEKARRVLLDDETSRRPRAPALGFCVRATTDVDVRLAAVGDEHLGTVEQRSVCPSAPAPWCGWRRPSGSPAIGSVSPKAASWLFAAAMPGRYPALLLIRSEEHDWENTAERRAGESQRDAGAGLGRFFFRPPGKTLVIPEPVPRPGPRKAAGTKDPETRSALAIASTMFPGKMFFLGRTGRGRALTFLPRRIVRAEIANAALIPRSDCVPWLPSGLGAGLRTGAADATGPHLDVRPPNGGAARAETGVRTGRRLSGHPDSERAAGGRAALPVGVGNRDSAIPVAATQGRSDRHVPRLSSGLGIRTVEESAPPRAEAATFDRSRGSIPLPGKLAPCEQACVRVAAREPATGGGAGRGRRQRESPPCSTTRRPCAFVWYKRLVAELRSCRVHELPASLGPWSSPRRAAWRCRQPEFERLEDASSGSDHGGRIVPLLPAHPGDFPKKMATRARPPGRSTGPCRRSERFLPADVRTGLPERAAAIRKRALSRSPRP